MASATTPAASDTTAPSVPTGLTATAVSTNQINLTWSASTDTGGSGLAGYKIYRGGTQIATVTGTSYTDTGLSASAQYCYTVAAYDNAANTSAQSAQSCATTLATIPAAPSGLTATAVATNQINPSWTDNSNNETGFKVERAPASSGPWTQIGTTGAGVTSYSSSGLSASSTYYYRVRATNLAGDSGYSSMASATTPAASDTTAPSVPTGLTATAVSTNQINLTWSASTDTGGSGLAGYKIYRGGTQTATVTGTSYTDTGLSASTQYCYTVAAYDNAANTSAQSSSTCALTQGRFRIFRIALGSP
jgi:chitodextrinase